MAQSEPRIAILGGGNLGQALALGWKNAGMKAENITVTRRHVDKLQRLADRGIGVSNDNLSAAEVASVVLIAVQPQQLDELANTLRENVDLSTKLVISVASGVSLSHLRKVLGTDGPLIRAMPNTGVTIGESMTCIAGESEDGPGVEDAVALFDSLGATLVIGEELMTPATALCACGVAFFLRCIRAASQGGIEIGFHPEEALLLAAQTARGAATLLLEGEGHPEREIDRVTTPRGCTIAGLNEMEHQGLSSALIRGIILSAQKAEGLSRHDP